MLVKSKAIFFCYICFQFSAIASPDFMQKKVALDYISNYANGFCDEVSHSGGSKNGGLSFKAKADLNKFLKAFADIGFEAEVKGGFTSYTNVLQKDLASVLQNRQNCKNNVFNKLVNLLLPNSNSNFNTNRSPTQNIQTTNSANKYNDNYQDKKWFAYNGSTRKCGIPIRIGRTGFRVTPDFLLDTNCSISNIDISGATSDLIIDCTNHEGYKSFVFFENLSECQVYSRESERRFLNRNKTENSGLSPKTLEFLQPYLK